MCNHSGQWRALPARSRGGVRNQSPPRALERHRAQFACLRHDSRAANLARPTRTQIRSQQPHARAQHTMLEATRTVAQPTAAGTLTSRAQRARTREGGLRTTCSEARCTLALQWAHGCYDPGIHEPARAKRRSTRRYAAHAYYNNCMAAATLGGRNAPRKGAGPTACPFRPPLLPPLSCAPMASMPALPDPCHDRRRTHRQRGRRPQTSLAMITSRRWRGRCDDLKTAHYAYRCKCDQSSQATMSAGLRGHHGWVL